MNLKLLIYKLKRPYHLVKTGLLRGLPAQIKYGFPARKLNIITITGTDGKTSSSTLLYHVLKTAGYKVALLTTVAAYVGDDEIDTGLHVTSPDPRNLHKILRDMVEQGVEYVVLEVTSHGVYQYRTWGIQPSIAGLTNITKEHLDYHITYNEYAKAKTLLLKKAKIAFINADDQSHGRVHRWLKQAKVKTRSYSLGDKLYSKAKSAITTRFPEKYNQQNAMLVYKISQQIGIGNTDFVAAIKSFPGIKGRMQTIPNSLDLNLIVDFAHTPNGVQAALSSLTKQKPAKTELIAVLGSAGLRDHAKRPAMGKISAELADKVVFTAEDPRTEDVNTIIRQMKDGVEAPHHSKVVTVPDRRQAIEFAITTLAKKGDTVAVLGKGHEQSMCFGTTEYPWSDIEIVAEVAQQAADENRNT